MKNEQVFQSFAELAAVYGATVRRKEQRAERRKEEDAIAKRFRLAFPKPDPDRQGSWFLFGIARWARHGWKSAVRALRTEGLVDGIIESKLFRIKAIKLAQVTERRVIAVEDIVDRLREDGILVRLSQPITEDEAVRLAVGG